MIDSKINLRGNQLFSAKKSDIIKYSEVLFTRNKNLDTPLLVEIPPHVPMMPMHEVLKRKIHFK